MAVRVDREALFKYSDKAFLGLALVFLAVSVALLLLADKSPRLTYGAVERLYQEAKERQRTAHEHLDELLKDDPALALVQKSPTYADTFGGEHQRLPAVGAERYQRVVYKAIEPLSFIPKALVRAPLLDDKDKTRNRRQPPEDLRLVAGKGYLPTGREPQGILGRDSIYVSGQFTWDQDQQHLWNLEAAQAESNVKWKSLQMPLMTDYVVERQEILPDGKQTEWRVRKTVRYEEATRRVLSIRRVKDGNPDELYKNEKARKKFLEDVRTYLGDVNRYQKELLKPPYYQMLGAEWISPYDQVEAGEPKGPAPGVGREAPVGPGEMVAPGVPAGPGPGMAPPAGAPGAQPRKVTVEGWFNDDIDPADVGKTFRYRVRVKFLNPIIGADLEEINPNHADEAWQVELTSAVSEPSEPIAIPPLVRFFFTGRFGDKASFSLFRWIYGSWHETRQTFNIGDAIAYQQNESIEIPTGQGGAAIKVPGKPLVSYNAGATIVDVFEVRFRHRDFERPSPKLIYQDMLRNCLDARLSVLDMEELPIFRKTAQEGEKVREVKRPGPITPGPPGPGPLRPPEEIPLWPEPGPPPGRPGPGQH